MTELIKYLNGQGKSKQPLRLREELWTQYCQNNLSGSDIQKTMQRITFDNFDALQRERYIFKMYCLQSDNVDWRSVQTCRADESETIFAECKSCRKKWRFR